MACDTGTVLYLLSAFFQVVTAAMATAAISLPQLLYFTVRLTNNRFPYAQTVSSFWMGAWKVCSTMYGCTSINPMSDLPTSDGDLLEVYRAFGTMGAILAYIIAIGVIVRTVQWARKSKSLPVLDGVLIGGSMFSLVSLLISMGVSVWLFLRFSGLQDNNDTYSTNTSRISLGASFSVQVVSVATAITALVLHTVAMRWVKKRSNKSEISAVDKGGLEAGLLGQYQPPPPSSLSPSPSVAMFQHPLPAVAYGHPIYSSSIPTPASMMNMYSPLFTFPGSNTNVDADGTPVSVTHYPTKAASGYPLSSQ